MRKIAVVGMGLMGRRHADVFRASPRTTLAALVEQDVGRHTQLAEEYGVPIVASLDQVMGECDAVSVCTPDDAHVQSARTALMAGLPVLVEKPLATTFSDARALCKLADERGVLLAVGHILRFDGRVVKAREFVRQGDLGDIWQVEVWRHANRALGTAMGRTSSIAWFLGIHDIDLVTHVCDVGVEAVAAVGHRHVTGSWDCSLVNLRFDGGAIGSMSNSWAWPNGRTPAALAGMRIVGSSGSIEVGLGPGDLVISGDEAMGSPDTRHWPTPREQGPFTLTAELEAFVDAIDGKENHLASGFEALRAVLAIEAVQRSLVSGGGWVELAGS